ncbi:MAG: T9SS type A sorting domain-containing protein [Bacteroidota bacterium]|jgi:photosystem II stability/assembly factor-like uncharacterized protein
MSEKYTHIRFVFLLSIGVTYLCFTQNKWSPVNGLYGGSVNSIIADSSNWLFAATECNTVLYSTNGGDVWSETNFSSHAAPLVLASNATTIFVATDGNGIYKSSDKGRSWIFTCWDGVPIVSLACSSTGELYAGIDFAGTPLVSGIYKSTDNGNNWTFSGLAYYYVTSIAISPNGYIFAGVQDSAVFRSTDHGISWIHSSNGFYLPRTVLTLNIDKKGNVYAGMDGLWRSTNNGETWTTVGNNSSRIRSIAFDTTGNIFVGGVTGLTRSIDDGRTWSVVDSDYYGTQINSIVVDKSNRIIAGGQWRGFTRSTDGGKTWNRVNNNFRNSDISSLTTNGNNIFAGITWDGVYSSSDNGNSWQHIWNSTNIPLAILADDSVLIVAPTNGNYGLFRSTDFGNNWIQTSLSSGVFSCLAKSLEGTYYAGGGSGIDYGVYSSTDKGVTWKYQLKNYSITGLVTTPLGNVFAITAIDGVFRSTDKGNNWAKIVFETGSPWRIVSSPSGDVYASFYDGYLYRLDDKSDTWNTVGGYFKSTVSNLVFLNDSTIVASTYNNGVILSKDRGNSWNEINTGLSNSDITNLIMTKGGAVFLSIYQGGLFQSSDSTLTFIKEFTSDIPVKIVLQNNYPNPFNPATIIKYQIPTNSFVSITVYDLLGKEITKLVNERQKTGNYSVKFDGMKYSSGIYFYRLQTNNFSETKKMLLIK